LAWFARGYDLTLAVAEWSALADWRARLLRGLRGRVLELGAGTGANLAYYPQDLEELVVSEPDPDMRAQLLRKAPAARVEDWPAEKLLAPDSHFDVVHGARSRGGAARGAPRPARSRPARLPRAHPRDRPHGPPPARRRARVEEAGRQLPLREAHPRHPARSRLRPTRSHRASPPPGPATLPLARRRRNRPQVLIGGGAREEGHPLLARGVKARRLTAARPATDGRGQGPSPASASTDEGRCGLLVRFFPPQPRARTQPSQGGKARERAAARPPAEGRGLLAGGGGATPIVMRWWCLRWRGRCRGCSPTGPRLRAGSRSRTAGTSRGGPGGRWPRCLPGAG
jgi:hypothetical protein